jgi:hypothetical protein
MTWLTTTEYMCHKWPRVCSTFCSFSHSWLIIGFVTGATRPVPLVEQELHTLQGLLNSTPVLRGVRVARSLIFCVVFCRSLFVLFLLAIVLSVRRYTIFDYPFDIFKLFFEKDETPKLICFLIHSLLHKQLL